MSRILLVHGAFGSAANWGRVVPALRDAGHSVEALDLPGPESDGTTVEDVSLDRYASHVCEALATGPPAVLVGHSMGGVVVTQAAARCPEHISQLVYVAAFVPGDGQSLIDMAQLPEGAGDQVQANMVVEGEPPVGRMPQSAARDALFGCCDDEQAAWAVGLLRLQPVAPFGQPVELSGQGLPDELPRAYVTCLRDRAIKPALQRRMLEAAGCAPVVEIDTDHSPWASRADELARALDRTAI